MNAIRFRIRFVVLLLLAVGGYPAKAAEKPTLTFERDVLPIFRKYCFNCHGKSSPQVGLELRSARLVMRGSQNGPVIVKGKPAQSVLWKKIKSEEMPVKDFKLKLTAAEKERVRRWIATGAHSTQSTKLPERARQQFARFKSEVLPIFAKKCISCHGEDAQEAQLDLRTVASLVRGSKTGPVIVEGFSEKSILIRKVESHAMPPKDADEPLTKQQIGTITRWIDGGYFVDYVDLAPRVTQGFARNEESAISKKDRSYWAFQKPVKRPLPKVRGAARARTAIDRFVLDRLESAGMTLSKDASRYTLLRRVYFDLTGLPPTPQQTREFLHDASPDAYERLVDRLLASPRYGERWGRHWLDATGYVDTSDKDFNPGSANLAPGIWRYRDYVIKATNEDKPWDRFLTEQFAGDELVDWRNAQKYEPKTLELLVATGFLRNALDATDEDISNLPFDRYEALFKLMERVSTATMGMTFNCARCHDHKFDPLPQSDYYRFLSFFTAAYNPAAWLPPKRRFLYQVSRQEQALRKKLTSRLSSLRAQIKQARTTVKNRLVKQRLASLPEALRADVFAAMRVQANKRNSVQKYLAKKFAGLLQVSAQQVSKSLSAQQRKQISQLQQQVRAATAAMPRVPLRKVQALWDVGKAPTIRILQRGDVDFPGRIVQPSFPQVLSAPGKSRAVPSTNRVGETTGLRLAFAEWLTDRQHPLTARVIVNRIWQHHFGRGIVKTPGNFGKSGSAPSHPELLDWLAVEFMENGWSAKHLHRLILLSTTYRQSSSRQAVAAPGVQPNTVDPENRLLWRMNLRRLEAEAIRDAVLVVSDQADFEVGGEPIRMKTGSDGLLTVQDKGKPNGAFRRSVYVLARRNYPLTFLRLFDFPTIDANCTCRVPSATPLQSLTLMNSKFLTDAARRLAGRVDTAVGTTAPVATKIGVAYQRVFSRSPSRAEIVAATQHLDELTRLLQTSGKSPPQAKRQSFERFVHMLLCSNEFLYVD